MKQSIPVIGESKPKLIASFDCLTPIIVQVFTNNTLYLAETDNALYTTNDFGQIDALQVNQSSGIITIWWIGDLWASGSAAFNCIIGIPGVNTGSGLRGSKSQPTNILPVQNSGTL